MPFTPHLILLSGLCGEKAAKVKAVALLSLQAMFFQEVQWLAYGCWGEGYGWCVWLAGFWGLCVGKQTLGAVVCERL